VVPVVKKKVSTSASKSRSSDVLAVDEAPTASKTKTKKKSSISSKTKSFDAGEGMSELVDAGKPLKSNLTKKKSTLNRLADMISKSPILEPLRNRPKRGGSTLIARANESALAQHDASVVSLNGTGVLGERAGNVVAVKKKKSDLKKMEAAAEVGTCGLGRVWQRGFDGFWVCFRMVKMRRIRWSCPHGRRGLRKRQKRDVVLFYFLYLNVEFFVFEFFF